MPVEADSRSCRLTYGLALGGGVDDDAAGPRWSGGRRQAELGEEADDYAYAAGRRCRPRCVAISQDDDDGRAGTQRSSSCEAGTHIGAATTGKDNLGCAAHPANGVHGRIDREDAQSRNRQACAGEDGFHFG
jgi:hypothetical protein